MTSEQKNKLPVTSRGDLPAMLEEIPKQEQTSSPFATSTPPQQQQQQQYNPPARFAFSYQHPMDPPPPPNTINPRDMHTTNVVDPTEDPHPYPGTLEDLLHWNAQSARYPELPRFALGQEVFILDTRGSEPSGLTTYNVISNYECEPGTGAVVYRLLPSQEVAFRVGEGRLLEAGSHPLGSKVQRVGGKLKSVVTRRYVVQGARFYDLRDESGETVVRVKEDDVQSTEGGLFPFVTDVAKEGV